MFLNLLLLNSQNIVLSVLHFASNFLEKQMLLIVIFIYIELHPYGRVYNSFLTLFNLFSMILWCIYKIKQEYYEYMNYREINKFIGTESFNIL